MKNIEKRMRDSRGISFAARLAVIAATCTFALAAHVWAQSPVADQHPVNEGPATQAANEGRASQATNGQAGTSGEAERPAFEVASIKKDTSNANMVRIGGPDVTRGPDPSRFSAANVTAKMLIGFAYDMRDFQISGGPSWIASERFDVDAKVDDTLAEQMRTFPRARQMEQMRLMMQSLLADRFQLSITHAQKELPVFALVVAKGGPNLTEAAPVGSGSASADPPPEPLPPGAVVRKDGPPNPPPGAMMMSISSGMATLRMRAAPLSTLVGMLSQQLGRQVVDETGLKGTYDISLQFSPEGGMLGGPLPRSPAGADTPDSSGTSIFTALQEQLGLKLESKKGPVDTIVIKHIEEASPN